VDGLGSVGCLGNGLSNLLEVFAGLLRVVRDMIKLGLYFELGITDFIVQNFRPISGIC